MADQENCMRLTRAAAKRKAEVAEGKATKKTRVVLGELPNVSNVVPENQELGKQTQKPKTKGKATKVEKALTTKIEEIESEGKKGVVIDERKVDIESNSDDTQMCGVYVSDIYDYLRKIEVAPNRRPLANYLEEVQNDVIANMRGVLVDWLVEVAEEYKLISDTLYFSVSYIDRFLSLNALSRQRLQLLGVASMLIVKYEEITPPHVEDFCYITDNMYTKEEVVKMEADVLKSLKFELGAPTVKTFLRRYTRVAQENLKECVLIIHDSYLGRRGGALQAIREKYKQHKFKCVATMPCSPEIVVSYFEDV